MRRLRSRALIPPTVVLIVLLSLSCSGRKAREELKELAPVLNQVEDTVLKIRDTYKDLRQNWSLNIPYDQQEVTGFLGKVDQFVKRRLDLQDLLEAGQGAKVLEQLPVLRRELEAFQGEVSRKQKYLEKLLAEVSEATELMRHARGLVQGCQELLLKLTPPDPASALELEGLQDRNQRGFGLVSKAFDYYPTNQQQAAIIMETGKRDLKENIAALEALHLKLKTLVETVGAKR
jgi:hypothetical protein